MSRLIWIYTVFANSTIVIFWRYTVLSAKKADNKINVCKFSKKVKSDLYHIETSWTRGQTV